MSLSVLAYKKSSFGKKWLQLPPSRRLSVSSAGECKGSAGWPLNKRIEITPVRVSKNSNCSPAAVRSDTDEDGMYRLWENLLSRRATVFRVPELPLHLRLPLAVPLPRLPRPFRHVLPVPALLPGALKLARLWLYPVRHKPVARPELEP